MIRAISKYWWVFALRGLMAIAFGLAALLWSTPTPAMIGLLFALFALLDSVLTIIASLRKQEEKGGWPLLFEGVAGLLGGVAVLLGSSIGSMLWPGVAAVMVVYYIAGWAILTGLFKTITAFRIRAEAKGEWALGAGGLVSMLLALILIVRAEAGILSVAWLIGIFAIALGILLTILGLKFHGEQAAA